MDEAFDHLVFSKNVIEFVTVSREFCQIVDNCNQLSKQEFISVQLKLLPLVYLKAVVLPKAIEELNDPLEKTCTEEIYEEVKVTIEAKLGKHNDYLEVFTPDINRSEGALSASVAEDLADIYQDLTDFLANYRTGITEIMNDALFELQSNFELFWGQKMVNCLRALHNVFFNGDDLSEKDEEETASGKRNTADWIFTRRQQEWSGADEENPFI